MDDDKTNAESETKKTRKVNWDQVKAILVACLIASLAVACIALVWRIVLSPVSIGEPATESEVVTRANERLIQMIQWMISSVLIVGGGLLSLNWYQSNQRYERDKEDLRRVEERVEKALTELRNAPIELNREIEAAANRLAQRVHSSSEREIGEVPVDGQPSNNQDEQQPATKRTSTIGTLFDNISGRHYLPRFQAEVEKFLIPNPLVDAVSQRKEAIQAILTMLESAKVDDVPEEQLRAQGIEHVWRLFPTLSADDAESAGEVRSYLKELGIHRPTSNVQAKTSAKE